MDQLRFVETAYRIQHQHRDGSWAAMLEEEEPTQLHHTPTEHDPERGWLRGRIFRCTKCAEAITVAGAEGGVPEAPGVIAGSAPDTARHVLEEG